MQIYDTIIIGAGAAGLKAAAELYKRHKSVLICDMGSQPLRKIKISGGGNCNFTNTNTPINRYYGQNTKFALSALKQFSALDTISWVKQHNIQYVEKEPGRFFCKNGSMDIINALITDLGNIKIQYNSYIQNVTKQNDIFAVTTTTNTYYAKSLIVATGGLSYPHLEVSNIGYKIAEKFGHKVTNLQSALCAIKTNVFSSDLAGISLPVTITIGKHHISDSLLFTHFGIGGPAVYRATLLNNSKWIINFMPNTDILSKLNHFKQNNGKKTFVSILSEYIPNKLAKFICTNNSKHIADYTNKELQTIINNLTNFEINDATPIGMQSAEVTLGGIATDQISSKTMESLICKNLFFAGEVLDITGDLGGFNIQWAFSSGYVAGNNA